MKKPLLILLLLFIQTITIYANTKDDLFSLIPASKKIKYFNSFITKHINNTDTYIEVEGSIKDKTLSVKKYKIKNKNIEITILNSSIKLDDFLKIKNDFLNDFAFHKVSFNKRPLLKPKLNRSEICL